MLYDPLVEAFEAGREQRQRVLAGQLFDDLLRQLPPLRRQRDDAAVGNSCVHRLERGRHDVDAQHHSRTTPVRLVVDLPGAEWSRVAIGKETKVELRPEDGGDRSLLRQPREGMRYESEDVELQGRAIQ